ncbi:MAG: YlxM family DNA-binding protein [Clostridiales bacterium]|nr:YlxM family DNA-binding protein [Clostridiales bacterium]
MEEKVEQTYLYDFYGELLNAHQRKIYEDFVFNDLSLSEIADEEGISRQGVHDMVKRCTRMLEGYEQKLHLIQKFKSVKQKIEQIQELAIRFHENCDDTMISEIKKISDQILEEL